jgi:hypothetical protein
MVVNRSHERDRTMTVRVDPDRLPVSRFGVASGRWQQMEAPCAGGDALLRLQLRPGEGALLRFGE